MKINLKSRNGLIHLYNPKKEGLGHYDVHYINAHKKNNWTTYEKEQTTNKRSAA